MKYDIFPISRPTLDQVIYAIGPDAKEHLAVFKGETRFDFVDDSFKGLFCKYWRELTEIELASIESESNSVEPVRTKRKYTKKTDERFF